MENKKERISWNRDTLAYSSCRKINANKDQRNSVQFCKYETIWRPLKELFQWNNVDKNGRMGRKKTLKKGMLRVEACRSVVLRV